MNAYSILKKDRDFQSSLKNTYLPIRKLNSFKDLPLQVQRVKTSFRWEKENGGPIQDLGYDNQIHKRIIQDTFNRKLAKFLIHYPSLKGNIALLSGPKVHHAVLPYFNMTIADRIFIAEKEKSIFSVIQQALKDKTFKEFEKIELYPSDILDLIDQKIEEDNQSIIGFDLDFCGSLSINKIKRITKIIKKINSSLFWIRGTFSIRPLGYKETEERIWKLISSVFENQYLIKDLACGFPYFYMDTSPMATFQIICAQPS